MTAADAPSRFSCLAGAAVIVAVMLGAGDSPAAAQTSDPGLFSITPARRAVIARPPALLRSTRVSNTTRSRLLVTVFPVLLRQQLDGAFAFGSRPAQLRAARLIMGVGPRRFALDPGEQREVSLRWQLLARGTRAAYMGVVFQAVPRQRGRSVGVVSRLLSVNFLRLPGHYRSSGRFTGMGAEQLGARRLRLTPRVRNTGQRVDSPRRARLAIRNAAGRVVFRRRWAGDVVLPGAERQFAVDVPRRLPAGRYMATARMRFGSRHRARTSKSFELVAPGRLASPRVALRSLQARGTAGEEGHLTGRLRSVGTAAAATRVRIELYAFHHGVQASRPGITRSKSFAGLEPGSRRELDASLGRLRRGHYRARVTYGDRPGSSQVLFVDFSTTPSEGLAKSVEKFLQRHEVLLILIAALAALAAVTTVMLSRQRRLAAQVEARTPPPAVPVPAPVHSGPAPSRPPGTEHALAKLALAAVTVAVLRRGARRHRAG
jgi:hypothetical protein